MVRYSQHGLDLVAAKAIVDAVVKRRYPFIEEIDGRVYVDIAESAREAAILILWQGYPRRMAEESLRGQLVRHQYSKPNADKGIKRIKSLVDNDKGKLKLRQICVQESEKRNE